VIYLKDTRILWNDNFAYKWSFKKYSNTAVLGVDKYTNPEISSLYDELKKKPNIYEMIFQLHPVKLGSMKFGVLNPNPLIQYSTELFDPG
jgi:hypothetical protein